MAAHVDALLLPLLGGAVLATLAGRGALAGLLLGLAAGVKLWPLLLATLEQALARRQRIDAFVAIATAVSLLAPERLFDLVPFAAEARALIWIGAAVHLLRARGLSPLATRPREAAAPHNAEPLGGDLRGCDPGSQG